MSFSYNTKVEISEYFGNARHCNIAEIAAIINICGYISQKKEKFCIKVQSENFLIIKKCFTLLKKTFNIDIEVLVKGSSGIKKHKVYFIYINNSEYAEKVLFSTGILCVEGNLKILRKRIYPVVVSSICCKRAYIRGAFLASGSISDPEKTYHLEFVNNDIKYCNELKDLINFFNIEAKIIIRKDNYVLYIKEGELIVNILNIMGAYVALMELENIRILKDMRNNINRIINCETANLGKIIAASLKQIKDINYIIKYNKFSDLSDTLLEIAKLRVEFPEASLKELGQMIVPPIGKSGVNHRLKKISFMADVLREENGDIQ